MSEAARAWLVSVVVEPNDDGFLATCPAVQGALAEGDTIEEAIFNCIDVIKMIGEYRAERGESLGCNAVDVGPGTKLTVSVPVGA